jgi:hypothetical protein
VKLSFDAEDLRPLVQLIVSEVLAKLQEADAAAGEKLAFSEQEAAQLLGLNTWQLRDERQRGRIKAAQIVGNRIRYTREDLRAYLARRVTGAN